MNFRDIIALVDGNIIPKSFHLEDVFHRMRQVEAVALGRYIG
jgi:sulfur carrier protein ThiS